MLVSTDALNGRLKNLENILTNQDMAALATLSFGSGTVTTTANFHVNGFSTLANGMAVNGGATFNNNVSVLGTLTVSSLSLSGTIPSLHATGVVEADGGFKQGSHNINFNASFTVPQSTPGAYPASGSPSNAGLGTYCNQICSALQSAGIFN